jgi:tRNA threonylcarbamoyladenosine biosynthesis protein TsaE
MTRCVFTTRSPEETLALARRLGDQLRPGDVIALSGPLGAGKTVFTKGIAEALGIAALRVTSPTFTLVHQHAGRLTLFHLDAYRLKGEHDLEALGADELLFGDGVCVIEWADRVHAILPPERLDVQIDLAGASERTITFTGHGDRAATLAQSFLDSRNED